MRENDILEKTHKLINEQYMCASTGETESYFHSCFPLLSTILEDVVYTGSGQIKYKNRSNNRPQTKCLVLRECHDTCMVNITCTNFLVLSTVPTFSWRNKPIRPKTHSHT